MLISNSIHSGFLYVVFGTFVQMNPNYNLYLDSIQAEDRKKSGKIKIACFGCLYFVD